MIGCKSLKSVSLGRAPQVLSVALCTYNCALTIRVVFTQDCHVMLFQVICAS